MNKLIANANKSKTKLNPIIMSFLFLVFFFVVQIVSTIILGFFLNPVDLASGKYSTLLNYFNFIVMITASVVWIKCIERRPSLHIKTTTKLKQHFFGALGATIAVSSVCFLSILITNKANLWQTADVSASTWLSVLSAFIFFLIQGPSEELFVRCAIMIPISRKIGVLPSIIVTSLLFSALHLANPGISIIPIINLFLAGAVFGIMIFYHESPCPAFGAHSLWNFVMGSFWGIEISGGTFGKSILHPVLEGPDLLTGGSFGVEGTIFTTILGVGIFVVYLVLYKRKFGGFSNKVVSPEETTSPLPEQQIKKTEPVTV